MDDQDMLQTMIEEVVSEVGFQMFTPDGADFSQIVNLPSMLLLTDEKQVLDIMKIVSESIVDGTENVVKQLEMEKKYQNAAMRALKKGMKMVENAFVMYVQSNSEPETPKGLDENGLW